MGFPGFSDGFPIVFFPWLFAFPSQEAAQKKVAILGPATVGGMMPGRFRIGNAGGAVETLGRGHATVGQVSRCPKNVWLMVVHHVE